MFQSKTLIIVGAGASKEARLPTGNELTATIADKVDIKFRDFNEQFSGDHGITAALRSHTRDVDKRPGGINPYLHACWRIRDAMPQAISIDSFIDDHQGDEKIELCGKLAIVQSILEAEQKSLLFFDHHEPNAKPDFNNLQETWYNSFMQLLTEGCHKENIHQRFEDVSFIIFNYDRCIEHFIFHALQNYYGIQPTEAARLIQELKIFHPYGVVGHLPWQNAEDDTPFGSSKGGDGLLALAGQIKTFAERIEDEATIMVMRQVVQNVEIVVFLGFAFHRQNLELIKPAQPTNAKRIFATALGISDSDCEMIEKEILKHWETRPQVDLNNGLTCRGLFGEYWRGLSLS